MLIINNTNFISYNFKKNNNMKNIEFNLNDLEQWSIGIYKMKGTAENMISGEIEYLDTIEIGFLFFSILIYF